MSGIAGIVRLDGRGVTRRELERVANALHQYGPDKFGVIAQDNVALAPLVSLDLVEDLTPYQGDLPSEIYGYLTEQMTFDGKLLFVPYRGNVQIAYYNTAVMEDLGLDPPTTIAEYRDVCQALYDEYGTGKCIFKGGGDQPLPLPTLLWEWIVSNDGDPMVLNDEEDNLFTLPEMRRADDILRQVYEKAGAADRYRCGFYPGPHKFDAEMQDEAFGWFGMWLTEDGGVQPAG